jgi:hypothetical protein
VFPETDAVDKKRAYKMAGVPKAGKARTEGLDLHVKNFIDCVRSRKKPVGDVEVGHQSVQTCHLANIAYRTGRIVRWDPAKEQVVGDADANALVSRAYRAPWKLPALS